MSHSSMIRPVNSISTRNRISQIFASEYKLQWQTVFIFIDFSKAFQKLLYDFSWSILYWLNSFLDNRAFFVVAEIQYNIKITLGHP